MNFPTLMMKAKIAAWSKCSVALAIAPVAVVAIVLVGSAGSGLGS